MRNKIFVIFMGVFMLAAVPNVASAESMIEIIDSEIQNVSISVNESTLHITGANGQVLHVYNVAGVRVMSVKVEGLDKRIELNLPKGCYIVKVGKVVRKISIK
jgi:hypothetical protein